MTKRFSIWTPCLIMFDCVEQNLIKHHEKFCLYKQVLCSLATQYNINMLGYQTLPIKTELNLILKLPATTWLKIRNTKLICFYASSFHSEFIGLIVLCENKRNETKNLCEMKNLYFAKWKICTLQNENFAKWEICSFPEI